MRITLFLSHLVGLSVMTIGVLGGTLPKRADNSLFNPDKGLPEIQDVIDFTKNVKAGKDDTGNRFTFQRTFALVAYALVHIDHGEQLKALFRHPDDQSEGIYELSYFEPIEHKRFTTLVGYESLLDMQEGTDLEEFKNRWWIAALWGVMKTEWESYFKGNKNNGIVLKATDKGKPYDDAMNRMAFAFDNPVTPWPIGDTDGKSAHWLMTVLLRRNIVISCYETEGVRHSLKSEDIYDLKEHGPVLWVGNPGGWTGSGYYEGYEGYSIQGVMRDSPNWPADSLVLAKTNHGKEKLISPLVQAMNQKPYFFHLFNTNEAWGPGWYDSDDLPKIDVMYPPPVEPVIGVPPV